MQHIEIVIDTIVKFHNIVYGILSPSKKTPKEKDKEVDYFCLPQRRIIIQQVNHSNARTNLNIRHQLQNNFGSNSELASRFNISEQTVYSFFYFRFGFRDCFAVQNGKTVIFSTIPLVGH
jgi:hypothetical protein